MMKGGRRSTTVRATDCPAAGVEGRKTIINVEDLSILY